MHNVSRIIAIVLVVVAVVLASAAFLMGKRAPHSDTVQAQPQPALSPPSFVSKAHAVVAAHMLPGGKAITAADLHLVELSSRPDGSYEQPELLAGQLPRVDIPEGTVITASLLSNPLAMALKDGERALAVPVDEVAGVGSRVLPGDYVDVILTLKLREDATTALGNLRERTQSQLLLSRVRVLAFGSRDLPPTGQAQGPATTIKPEQVDAVAHFAVLAVPVGDIDPLELGVQAGKLSLALRHPGDDGVPTNLLFPSPRPVLSPMAGLSTEQRSWLTSPENRAYAGVDDMGVAGMATMTSTMRAPNRSSMSAGSGIEIIRGAEHASAQKTVSP